MSSTIGLEGIHTCSSDEPSNNLKHSFTVQNFLYLVASTF